MSAVRHESAALETLKAQMKGRDSIKKQIPILKDQLAAADEKHIFISKQKEQSDEKYKKLQLDLQRLNDMYQNERRQNLESQEKQLSLHQELALCKLKFVKTQKSAPRIIDLKKINHAQKLQIENLNQSLEDEKRLTQKIFIY